MSGSVRPVEPITRSPPAEFGAVRLPEPTIAEPRLIPAAWFQVSFPVTFTVPVALPPLKL